MKLLISIFLFSVLFAGGWTKKRGSLFLKYEYLYLNKTHMLYSTTGGIIDLSKRISAFVPYEYQVSKHILYGEYGITDSWTVIASIPFVTNFVRLRTPNGESTYANHDISDTSLGDIQLGFRYGIIQNQQTVYATSINVFIPTGNEEAVFTYLDQSNSKNAKLASGDGELNVNLSFELGHSFARGRGYLTSAIGVGIRGKEKTSLRFIPPISLPSKNENRYLKSEFLFSLDIGYWIAEKKLLTTIKLNSVAPFGGFNETPPWFSQAQFNAVELEAFYKIKGDIGATFSYITAFNVKNYLKAGVFKVGLALGI